MEPQVVKVLDKECLHCKELLTEANIKSYGEFCCIGCQFVYSAISKSGLSDFYAFRDKLSEEVPEKGIFVKTKYLYLDDADYQREILLDSGEDKKYVLFKVQGMHCGACVWLLERIALVLPGVLRSEPSLLNRDLKVVFDPTLVKLSQIASTISNFGYVPSVIDKSVAGDSYSLSFREDLSRLAVSVFSAMNCMMLAVSLYQGWWSGMEDAYRKYLNLVSLVVCIPAVFYSAMPFYRRAYTGLKSASFHLDLPISIGVLIGFFLSCFSVISGRGEVYFDSISILIALLLGARFIQEIGILKFKKSVISDQEVLTKEARVLRDSKIEAIYSGKVVPGDVVLLEEGDIVPVDGSLVDGGLQIDSSVLTGESEPHSVKVGELVFAGTMVVGGSAQVLCEKRQEESFFPQTLRMVRNRIEIGSEIGERVDIRSKFFVWYVLLAGIGSFSYFLYVEDIYRAIEVTLSVFVISCPCALGLSVPLAFSSAYFQASKLGILFSGGRALENLASASSYFFDKTGTLTEGSMQVVECVFLREDLNRDGLLQKVKILEEGVFHPVGRGISAYIGSVLGQLDCKDISILKKEMDVRGGVVGQFNDGDFISVGSLSMLLDDSPIKVQADVFSSRGLTPVVVLKGEEPVIIFALKSTVREGAKSLIEYLFSIRSEVYLLSGDRKEVVLGMAEELGIKKENTFYQKRADEKSLVLSSYGGGKKVMVGDGLNDSSALSMSDVGISVSGGVQLLQKDGNISITNFSPYKLISAIKGSISTLRVVNLNLTISFLYNLFCTSLAVSGNISPLMAAILMPISSLLVIVVSLFGVKFKED